MLLSKKLIEVFKNLILLCLTVLLTGTILAVFLVAIYSIPLNSGNFEESVRILESEGDRPDILERNTGDWSNAGSFEPGILSTTNELANVYRAGGMDDKSPVYNAIVMDSLTWGPYPRYWHYYAGVLRIMLLVFDIKEIRFVNFLFQLLVVVAIMWLISDRKSRLAALLFLTVYVLMMPLAVSGNSVYSFGLNGTLFGTYLLLLMARKRGEDIFEKRKIYIAFCLMGIMICALDQLITCITAWALPALLIIYMYGGSRKILQNLLTVVTTGISWIIGYAGSWLFKILIAGMYMKSDILAGAMNQTSVWTEGLEEYSPGRLFSLYTVYKHYTYKVFAIIIILWAVFLAVKLLLSKIKSDSRIPALMLVSLGPIVWNLVLYEHVFYHHIMTYRQLSVSIAGLLFIIYVASGEKAAIGNPKGLMGKSLLFLSIVILGIILTFSIKETQDVYNADIPGTYISFDGGTDAVSMNINPSYKHISGINLGINSSSDNGYYKFELLENNNSVDLISVPASKYNENPWQTIETDWNLKKGNGYVLRISAIDTDPGSELYVLDTSIASPTDLSDLVIGGINVAYRPVFWITYLRNPMRIDFVFYTVTFYLIILSVCMVTYTVMPDRLKDGKRSHKA